MELVELSDYRLAPIGDGKGIRDCRFSISRGDIYSIDAALPDDAKLFLRALATLAKPLRGTYRFQGEQLDFSDYRRLLPIKRRIAYIAPDAALLSNRTLIENLLLPRSYFENVSDWDLPDDLAELCREFRITERLNLRPGEAAHEDVRLTVLLRELSKKPDLLLLERPRDFLTSRNFDVFAGVLKGMTQTGIPAVFLDPDSAAACRFPVKVVRIADGSLQTENS